VARTRSRPTAATERAFSAGGIVIRHGDDGPQLILGRRARSREGAAWSLPKGTPDGEETPEQTALREVQEETGLEVRIIESVGAIQYRFTRDGRRIHKTVHYFLMEATGGDVALHDQEFEEVRWFGLAEAEAVMRFPTEREIVAQARAVTGLG